jgi:son of sevenless-like protein
MNVFRHWVEFHYYAFKREPKLLVMLEEFVGSIRSRSMQNWATSIHRAIKRVQ